MCNCPKKHYSKIRNISQLTRTFQFLGVKTKCCLVTVVVNSLLWFFIHRVPVRRTSPTSNSMGDVTFSRAKRMTGDWVLSCVCVSWTSWINRCIHPSISGLLLGANKYNTLTFFSAIPKSFYGLQISLASTPNLFGYKAKNLNCRKKVYSPNVRVAVGFPKILADLFSFLTLNDILAPSRTKWISFFSVAKAEIWKKWLTFRNRFYIKIVNYHDKGEWYIIMYAYLLYQQFFSEKKKYRILQGGEKIEFYLRVVKTINTIFNTRKKIHIFKPPCIFLLLYRQIYHSPFL